MKILVQWLQPLGTSFLLQIQISVTVSGSIFSEDGLRYNHSTLPTHLSKDNYLDYIVDATSATYTVIRKVGVGAGNRRTLSCGMSFRVHGN